MKILSLHTTIVLVIMKQLRISFHRRSYRMHLVQAFGFRVSGFGSGVLVSGFQVWGLEFQVLGFGFGVWVSVFEFGVLRSGISCFGFRVLRSRLVMHRVQSLGVWGFAFRVSRWKSTSFSGWGVPRMSRAMKRILVY